MVEYKYRDPRKQLTLAYVRDAVRKGAYVGDLFEALKFMLTNYDVINNRLHSYTHPTEYVVQRQTGEDVV